MPLITAAPAPTVRHRVWRGDLLRVLSALAPPGPGPQRQCIAALCGFDLDAETAASSPSVSFSAVDIDIDVGTAFHARPTDQAARPAAAGMAPREPLRARLVGVLEQQQLTADAASSDSSSLAAMLAQGQTCLDDSILQIRPVRVRRPLPLVARRPLADLLRRQLRPPMPGRQIDVQRWLLALAQGRMPKRLPQLRRRAWGEHAGLVWLASPGTQVLARDYHEICEQVHRLSGGQAPVLLLG